jgi:tripartite-type tricarboxylate transporter receptor subunit TctC
MIDDPTNFLPLIRAGRIKAYAVTAKRRLAAAPDIPIGRHEPGSQRIGTRSAILTVALNLTAHGNAPMPPDDRC